MGTVKSRNTVKVKSLKRLLSLCVLCVLCGLKIHAQNFNPAVFIGLTIADLYSYYGPPESVYAARGAAMWQDDVVFVYKTPPSPIAEYYIYQNRVWQVKIDSYGSIKDGDSRTIIPMVLGNYITEGPDYTLVPLQGGSWPLALRFAIDPQGKISGMYIYRSDL
ncbi:MAG: hypothetical protein LBM77_14115 [Spirochaetaceae bacterium]|jgi:hypothetical protein|nr:hypothetical protein [Spirochaetaceae bacterium]